MPKNLTTEEFIRKSLESRGGSSPYDYSESIYKNNSTKITVICPKHGRFLQNPRDHYTNKSNCPKCYNENRTLVLSKGLSKFLVESKVKFGDKFDFSNFKYINNKTDGEIICPIHGTFLISPSQFLKSPYGCPSCSIEDRGLKSRVHFKDFVLRSTTIHGFRYIYHKPKADITTSSFVDISCVKHGVFSQLVSRHLRGHGCPKCGRESTKKSLFGTYEKWEAKANTIHKNKYSYNNLKFIGNTFNGVITCPIHGNWSANLRNFISKGTGCPSCSNNGTSLYESEIIDYIRSFYSGEVIQSYRPEWLNGKELDIFIPEFNFAIEFNGAYWHSEDRKSIDYHFEKWKTCKKNNITLINIWDFYYNLSEKKNIYFSKIKHFMKFDEKFFARKCLIRAIDKDAAIDFVRSNHWRQTGRLTTPKFGCEALPSQSENRELYQKVCFTA